MDYKKKTQVTLKQMETDGKISQADAEKYFPELAQSEDEKIRKALINTLQNKIGVGVVSNGYSREDYIDWLEKQGEQKPDKIICNPEVCIYVKNHRDIQKPVEENKGNYGGISTNSKWKPSLQQINALSITIKHGQMDDIETLKELLEQLKAL